MKATVFNINGEKVKDCELPAVVFNIAIDQQLIKQVVVSYEANKRQNLAHAKTRGEVSGGGKKPWKQKGTGRARHGSIRSPLWVGGGVTFGPRAVRNFAKKINKKVARKALAMVLTDRAQHEAVHVVDSFNAENKTKTYAEFLKKVEAHKAKRVLMITKENSPELVRSVSNLPGVSVKNVTDINAYDIIRGTKVIFEEGALELLAKRLS